VVYEHFEYLKANPHTFLGMMRRSPSTPDVEPIFEAARQESTDIILGHLGLDIQLDALGSAALRGWPHSMMRQRWHCSPATTSI